jgi:hypothetical protein
LQSDFTFMTYPSYTSSIASVHHLWSQTILHIGLGA